jgi:hypothetical protein
LLDYEEFLRKAGCADGEARHVAELALVEAERAGVLTRVPHRRDPKLIQQIRFSPAREQALFERAGGPSPTQRRQRLAEQFANAAQMPVPQEYEQAWQGFCARFEEAALHGGPVAPFERELLEMNSELLSLTPKLLAWRGESLLRFASCVLCDNSKRLEGLAGRLGQILEQLSGGKLRSLEDLGIAANPRFALLHGPLRLRLNGDWLNLGLLAGPVRLAERDIRQAQEVETPACRCLTVENETTFHELAKLQSGELLIQTSFPGSGTLALLGRLPETMEFWHFGDTDVEGYEILRDLRERAGRPFRGLHMRYRTSPESPPLSSEDRRRLERLLSSSLLSPERRELEAMLANGREGRFEQESLGVPLPRWPFYRDV